MTVVGVAGDVKQMGPFDLMGEGMELYSAASGPFGSGPDADGSDIGRRRHRRSGSIRDELKTLDPLLAIVEVSTMEQRLADSIARPRFLLRLAWVFAIVATLLAAVGVYGTTTYWVLQRQRELGVRMALGSTPAGLVRLVLGRGLRLTAWASAVGLGGSLLFGEVLQSMLFETAPNDPVVLASTVGALAVLVIAACAVPAIRASRVDAMSVLRAE